MRRPAAACSRQRICAHTQHTWIKQLPARRPGGRAYRGWRVLDERDPHSHGATLTDENGDFRLEMPQTVPAFGQAHGHLAYDSGDFKTVFLRPVMPSPKDTALSAHLIL